MRLLVALLVITAGCINLDEADTPPAVPVDTCADRLESTTLYFGQGHALTSELGADGAVFSNGFDEAFLTDVMDEWHSDAWPEAMRVVGNMTLEFWVRNHGTPAPVVLGGAPGEGYHWFNQVGTNRGFVEAYGREYATVTPEPGSIDHYNETIAMPPGGLHIESGDHLRVLLTSLVLDDGLERGQEILFGENYPSHIRFEHHCMANASWTLLADEATDIEVPGHRGLITGQVPATEDFNFVDVPFTLDNETQRLTISLTQRQDRNPLKDDMDLVILDSAGTEATSIGSPYSNELGTLYSANLEALMPPGDYTVRVYSYSGHDYTGTVQVIQDAIA